MNNHMTTAEARAQYQDIKGAYIKQPMLDTGNGTHVFGAAVIQLPSWVVITDDPAANRTKKVAL